MGTPQIPAVDSTTRLFPEAVMTSLGSVFAPAAGSRWANVNNASTARARAAFAGVRAGTRSAKVLCVGDSTTAGYGASVAQSYPAFLSTALASYLPTRAGLAIPPREVPDPRWSFGGWVLINTFGWADSLALMSDGSSTGVASFTPGAVADTFDVYFFGTGGYGTLHIELDTGEKIDVDTSAAAGTVAKATVKAAALASTHVVNLYNPSSANVAVLGVDAYRSDSVSVRVGNAGVSGTRSAQWGSAQGGSVGSGSAAAIRGYAPDLTLIMLGINDAKQSVGANVFASNISQTVEAARSSGSVLLMSVVPSNTAPEEVLEQSYRSGMSALAQSLNAGYLDIFGRFGSYASSQAVGMYSDGLHPSAQGYADIAHAVAAVIRSI